MRRATLVLDVTRVPGREHPPSEHRCKRSWSIAGDSEAVAPKRQDPLEHTPRSFALFADQRRLGSPSGGRPHPSWDHRAGDGRPYGSGGDSAWSSVQRGEGCHGFRGCRARHSSPATPGCGTPDRRRRGGRRVGWLRPRLDVDGFDRQRHPLGVAQAARAPVGAGHAAALAPFPRPNGGDAPGAAGCRVDGVRGVRLPRLLPGVGLDRVRRQHAVGLVRGAVAADRCRDGEVLDRRADDPAMAPVAARAVWRPSPCSWSSPTGCRSSGPASPTTRSSTGCGYSSSRCSCRCDRPRDDQVVRERHTRGERRPSR